MKSRRAQLMALVVAAVFVALASRSVDAYLKLGVELVSNRVVTLQWSRVPVEYWVNEAGTAGVSGGQFEAAIRRAASTWEAVPTSTIAYRFAGPTTAEPGADDGRSVLGFQSRPDLDRVLAATSFLYDVTTGEVLESDIFFNSTFAWSVAAEGEANRYDLESIALHELGHFSGLGHSAIGETDQLAGGRRVIGTAAVMFPIAFSAGSTVARVLRPDDVAGISDLYPETGFRDDHGSLSGRVTKNGRGVLGAHAVAFRIATGELVGGFSLNDDGTFSIAGLLPGPYVIRVEPLDDADVESFFDADDIDVDFRGAYAKRLAVVPRGGDSGVVDVTVVAK